MYDICMYEVSSPSRAHLAGSLSLRLRRCQYQVHNVVSQSGWSYSCSFRYHLCTVHVCMKLSPTSCAKTLDWHALVCSLHQQYSMPSTTFPLLHMTPLSHKTTLIDDSLQHQQPHPSQHHTLNLRVLNPQNSSERTTCVCYILPPQAARPI